MNLNNMEGIKLRPAELKDKRKVYEWMAMSNLTSEMMGPPNFPEVPIPSWTDFQEDFVNHYFEGSNRHLGQCFIILKDGQEVGQINYNTIDSSTLSTELDLWLSDRIFTRQGIGGEALSQLETHLLQTFKIKTLYLAPSLRNTTAIKAYRKAGFAETEDWPKGFVPDYHDTVLMKKSLG